MLCAALTCAAAATSTAAPLLAGYVPRPCRAVNYHSVPKLEAQRVCMNLGVITHGTQARTYLFLTAEGFTHRVGGGIYRDDGTLVWWHKTSSPIAQDMKLVHFQGHPYLALWSGMPSVRWWVPGTVTLYNEHYQRVGVITAAGRFPPDTVDTHEFQITPQGDALFGIYDLTTTTFHGQQVRVYQYVVQKVSLVHGAHGIRTGRLLFQWKSLGAVPVSQSHLPPPSKGKVWDYFHGNDIAQDTDGNLLVSSRNTWGIYKINVKTGHIMWQLGAKGDATLATPWCYQHDLLPQGSGRYSMFDDGGTDPGCVQGGSGHLARGLIFQVHGSGRSARAMLIHSYGHNPGISTGCCGSMQLLGDRDALIDWGGTPEVTEYGPGGDVRMDLSLSNWSYRAFRVPWVGEPVTRPAVAAQLSGSGTKVWASWNGSTEVVAWRILAGARPSGLSVVESREPKRCFETSIFLPHPYASVAVQALGAGGQVLATSRPVMVKPAVS